MIPGTVIAISGHMGSGKGLLMTWLSMQFKHRGYGVWANYDNEIAYRLETMAELVQSKRGLLLLDEVDLILPARGFGDKRNILFTQWCKLMRKSGLRLAWATQNWYFVDINLRRVTHYLLECTLVHSALTKVDLYRVVPEDIFMHKLSFLLPHNDILYQSFDTYDRRMVLSWDVDGRAAEPLSFVKQDEPITKQPARSRRSGVVSR